MNKVLYYLSALFLSMGIAIIITHNKFNLMAMVGGIITYVVLYSLYKQKGVKKFHVNAYKLIMIMLSVGVLALLIPHLELLTGMVVLLSAVIFLVIVWGQRFLLKH
ncbi:MAG: hypothetical protein Q4A55_04010 [Aerococcus sp.]|nr:hypothetical protein [Aerococcus sp.]